MQLLTSRRIGGGGIGGRVRRTNAAAAAAAAPPPRCDASSPPVPGQNVTPSDRAHLRRALDLARLGLGHTAPNPAVGCVLVAPDGRTVVGEGYHPRAGLPHAEVYALRAAGRAAEGATAYVTLEPCGHHGRTPPCAEALRDARVARVVVGCADPNPLVAGGGGLAALRAAGVAVALADGEEERLCRDLNPEFMARMEAEAEGAAKRRAEGEKEGAARR
jgi:diaminohydroxyphosphoribosylaminopyrimidine deaminase/5-amino-6-(5-phosphoribosylamino)uracil reductase